ncbi:TonB-dependent receptor [Pedobacter frigiditerrae]|uniref:TonB-dependent receptor n=1 Tax=Pedobacter frigiditerrae TaxID=2530452 RepID=A0A4R0N3Y0_9SPHI|nr:TonB-dependent receptor [Pedobacter frigiditerrae]TCC94505.1 TonB-dependent receptor [Pedobacter frigiditerrae]
MKKIFTKFSVLIVLCLLLLNVAYAQNVTIKGVVKDDAGLAVPSASVIIKGTTNGTQTDVNGNYSISAPANGTLVFTYIGYTTQEIAINNRTTINVDFKSATNDLQQVVVVGYGTQKKRDLTGSIASVKGEDIEKLAVTNPIAALQGKVPGLTISNSGSPGSSPTVRIRGINSTNGSANPLYVVDGLLQDNIDYLNPADIESIDLLRDASSVAIFGLRGANGVIAVTTKRAARGKTRVNFQSTLGIQHVTNQIDVVDANGFKKLYSAQLANLKAAPFDYTNYTANTNWQDQMIRDAVINTNSLSVSNSGEKSTTLINIGYNNQDGIIKYNNYKKFIARLSEEIKITDKIKVGADLTGFHWRNEPTAASLNNALWAAPIVGVKNDAGLYYTMPSFQRAQVGNLVYSTERNRNTSIQRGYRINGSLFAEVKFLKDFTLKSTVYTDLGFNNTRGYSPLPYTVVNLGEGVVPTATFYDNTVRTSVNQNTFESRRYQQDHTLNYDKEYKGGHKLNAIVGFTSFKQSTTTLEGSRRDTTLNVPNNSNLWYLGIINANNPSSNGGGGTEFSNTGVFGRISYAYQNKYLLNASIRRDGSSIFAPKNRWGTFGSVGLGWVASEETFFKDNVKGIDFLKLRAAWGRLGNANGATENRAQVGLDNGSTAIFGDNIYTAVSEAFYADPDLRFEVVQGIDLGLDIRALNNRLSTEVNLYNKTSSGIITAQTLPGTTKGYVTNLGKISNKGIEVSLSWNDKITSELTYNISGNFGYNKNKVNSTGITSFQLLGNGGVNLTETGRSIGYFYGYTQTGIYQSTADLDKTPHFANSLPGDISYADINGDGIISPLDRGYLGTPFPPYSYGLSIGLAYKGFDATIEGQGVAGNKIYTQRRTANFSILNYESNRLNAWTTPGSSNIEPILDNSRGNNLLFSTYFLEPGDYFRLRNVQLGYTFGANALTKVGISKLRLFVSGQNVKTWTKATGYTPEAQLGNVLGSGADNGIYPVPAIYSFGLNVTF